MKKLLCVLLAVLACILCACESESAKLEKLAGTWQLQLDDSPEQARRLLENIEAYPEELALADLSSLDYVQVVVFDAAGHYRYALDAAGTKRCVAEFYDGYFGSLFQGRDSLSALYETDFSAMDQPQFLQFYAQVYGFADYDSMRDAMVQNACDYGKLSTDLETGSFTLSGSYLLCTVTGESEAEKLGYSISADGRSLTLTYADATEVYTKTNE